MANGDFHLHSTASDGVYAPARVVEMAAEAGVTVMCLSDHDTTNGIPEAAEAAARLGLRLIPGMELSSNLELRTRPGQAIDAHLLVYGIARDSEAMQRYLAWQREERIERAKKAVAVLNECGLEISVARVFELALGGSVGRPHVARALVERGYVESVQRAFDEWLGDGKPGDIPRAKLSPREVIDLAHAAGGVVFLAHPFRGDLVDEREVRDCIRQLAEAGLDGVEVYYKNYEPERIRWLARIADEFGLQRSGGSDFHGLGNPEDRGIGDIPFPGDRVEAFTQFIEDNCREPYVKETTNAAS